MKHNSVQITVNNNLCTGCGVCPSTCPHNAIKLKVESYMKIPNVNKEKCTNCGICLKVCSGINVYEEGLDEGYDPIDYINTSNIKRCTTLSVKDNDILLTAQSGGAISEFIIQSLASGTHEGAFLAPSEDLNYEDKRLELYKKKEDVLDTAGSKYVVYSTENILEYLGSDKKYILVSIPCHIQSIKKYCDLKNIDDSNILYLGLFCDQILNYAIIDILKIKLMNSNRDFVKFSYRGKLTSGWPGKLEFQYKDGVEGFDSKHRMYLKKFLQLERCYYCGDKLNKYSDISFGDCYIKNRTSFKGKSNIIIRTKKGLDYFNELNLNRFDIDDIDYSEIFKSQKYINKKKNILDSQFLPNDIILYKKAKVRKRKKNSSYYIYKKDIFFLKLCRKKSIVSALSKFSTNNLKKLHRFSVITGAIINRLLS
ncbi:MAG: Coenzyme F420 hydrogenase/dehydrogenase, beta subunit C-terminal domain [Spirochaetaceae bacterium]